MKNKLAPVILAALAAIAAISGCGGQSDAPAAGIVFRENAAVSYLGPYY